VTDTRSGHYPEPTNHHAKKEPINTIACRICDAIYTPSQEHTYLLQAPPMVLESALMSMCHFCFRCRRPACPHCWDNIHGVCGECCLEANLPFRAQAAPLRGVIFASTRQAQMRRKHATPVRLVCIRSGRFQNAASIDTAETFPLQSAIMPPRTTASRPKQIETDPLERPQVHQTEQRVPQPPQRRITIDIDQIATRPPYREADVDIDEIATRPPRLKKAPAYDEVVPRPLHIKPTMAIAKHTERPARSFWISLERIITTLLFIALICIILLILLAMLSMDANVLIQNYLHVDIRAEITALWQLIEQFHI
jgi:hypothetical protein